MEIHIESALQAEGLVGVGSVVDRVVTIWARCVGVGFGQSGFEDLVLGVIFGVEACFSASMIAETEIFDLRKLTRRATLSNNADLPRYIEGESSGDKKENNNQSSVHFLLNIIW